MARAQASVAAAATAVVAAFSLCGASCLERTLQVLDCQIDKDCPEGHACTGGGCLPKGTGAATWAVELLPKAGSSWARTDSFPIAFAQDDATLSAEPRASIAGRVQVGDPAKADSGAGARVIVSLPSLIPGRPDLQFEAESPAARAVNQAAFALSIPASALGRFAAVRVIPSPPADESIPPFNLVDRLLSASLVITFPSAAELVQLDGTLVSAIGAPAPGFTARAFRRGAAVSTVKQTDASGVFRLAAAPGQRSTELLGDMTIELHPADRLSGEPMLVTWPFSVLRSKSLGELRLPAFSKPDIFRFQVAGRDGAMTPISGASVRFRTVLDDAVGGTAVYRREAITDAAGYVQVPLLSGIADKAREYDVAVIPPSTSSFALRCIPRFAVTSGGGTGLTIQLSPKVGLRGRVYRSDGAPAAGVTILATRLAADAGESCSGEAAASPPVSTTTDSTGYYQLRLDPGVHRLEHEPAKGAPMPRMTEEAVTVVDEDTEHEVVLPPGGIVDGSAVGPDGSPLPSAEIRIYQILPSTASLAGHTQSGADGRFRVVLPFASSR